MSQQTCGKYGVGGTVFSNVRNKSSIPMLGILIALTALTRDQLAAFDDPLSSHRHYHHCHLLVLVLVLVLLLLLLLQIGRAVQQECRDRSRMPSSA
eukprot:TRINITY_DN18701_c0_g1_i2.p1 TRINITY_DN18701_c0_g1~~TRINITY_DN18701_c0_g1_i2.p1  ORF type:complete len:105 (-),score=2.64 TRINITY_DN18701_c0_g1_i2:10-297(-)